MEEILNVLKKDEWLSTSKIAFITNGNYYRVENALNNLLDDGKVEKKSVGKWSFWRIA